MAIAGALASVNGNETIVCRTLPDAVAWTAIAQLPVDVLPLANVRSAS
jgi:hypothetical protein